MTWIVVIDRTSTDPEDNRVGHGQWVGGPSDNPHLETLPYRAELYDDDGEHNYTVAFDNDALDYDEDWGGLYQCLQWAMADVGTTDLRIKGESIYG